jgi:tetratricopeptide (TPR) repeat protein
MLNQKLEEARLNNERRRNQYAVGILSSIALIAAILFGLSSIDSFSERPLTSPIPSVEETRTNEAEIIAEPESNTPAKNTDTISPSSSPSPSSNEETTPDPERALFKSELGYYESKLEPQIQSANLAAWDSDAATTIQTNKEKAITSFGLGEYAAARRQLLALTEVANTVLIERERSFNEKFDNAEIAFWDDNYDEAIFSIGGALTIKPDSTQALALHDEIEKLPELLPYLKTAEIARTENNIKQELSILKTIKKVAPTRKHITSRIKELTEIIQEQDFEANIKQGMSALGERRTKTARRHYQAAKTIYPSRSELPVLLNDILNLEKSTRIESALAKATQSVRRDDWATAKTNYTSAAKDAPDDVRVVEGLQRANEILNLIASLTTHLKNPYRLTDNQVRKTAEAVLVRQKAVSQHSFSLMQQAQQLSELIEKINIKVPVEVSSDNQTFIRVRGVGHVGKTSRKTIHLKPGSYYFEGQRDGFESILVKIDIPVGQESHKIEIICNEPI